MMSSTCKKWLTVKVSYFLLHTCKFLISKGVLRFARNSQERVTKVPWLHHCSSSYLCSTPLIGPLAWFWLSGRERVRGGAVFKELFRHGQFHFKTMMIWGRDLGCNLHFSFTNSLQLRGSPLIITRCGKYKYTNKPMVLKYGETLDLCRWISKPGGHNEFCRL